MRGGTGGVSGCEMGMDEGQCGEEKESVMANRHGYEMRWIWWYGGIVII